MRRVDHIIFLHGVGGHVPIERWTTPLDRRLREHGYPVLDSSIDSLIAPSYLDVLDAGQAPEEASVESTYTRLDEKLQQEAQLTYVRRRMQLSAALQSEPPAESGWGFDFGIPEGGVTAGFEVIEARSFPLVKRYRTNEKYRNAVQRKVLSQLPSSGTAILVAHSLGSVVAADLIRKLPKRLTVDLLLTIGSPLWLDKLRKHCGPLGHADFPYDRVRSWINIYAPQDLITFGRGIASKVPPALDLYAHLGTTHDLEAYMSHPSVAKAVHLASHPAGNAVEVVNHSKVGRRLHRAWQPMLIASAFNDQVSQHFPLDEWRTKGRFDTAREINADATMMDISRRKAVFQTQLAEFADQLRDPALVTALSDGPIAEGRHPTRHDLLAGAADVLRDEWSDEALVAPCVGLMMQPLVPPFDIGVKPARRGKALAATLDRVRRRSGNLSDERFANAIRDAVGNAQSQMADERGVPWGTVLFVGGAALLAATGVGLLAAALLVSRAPLRSRQPLPRSVRAEW